MKINISKESVVYQGPCYEDSSWGFVQFPKVYVSESGALYCRTHVANDEWREFGKGNEVWCKSTDFGKTWIQTKDDVNKIIGTKLPSGDIVNFYVPKPVTVKGDKIRKAKITIQTLPGDKVEKSKDDIWPYPTFSRRNIFGQPEYIYDIDTIPDGYNVGRFLTMNRIKKGENDYVSERVTVKQKYMSVLGLVWEADNEMSICTTNLTPVDHHIKLDKEGNVWITNSYGGHINPFNGAPNPFSAVFVYKSTDNAKTFELQSYIPFVPDTSDEKTAYLSPCFNESDIEFMDDGSIIALLRTTDVYNGGPEWNPMYFARSVDGGKTFSKPVKFSEFGVLPNLLKLGKVTLAVYGRPGIYVRATEDPSGLKWEEPIEVMEGTDRSVLMNNPPKRPDFHQYVGSCCNVDVKKIDEKTAVMVYSDFYYPDVNGSGKKLKTILSRTITIE